jgi:transposase
MDYFAGLDISMDETHICVVDRDGSVVYEGKSASTAEAIADKLSEEPGCHRIVFETGRMAPILFHGLSQLGLPVVCVESRQAYQALKSLATHKTDRNDARGLAHLARTGFFKPVHMKSLSAHAVRSLIIARKKLVGQRVTLENQIRGLAVVFGVRLPRALTAAFIDNAVRASEGIAGLCAAMRGSDCGANCGDECGRGDRRRHKAYDKGLCSLPPADDESRRRPTDSARLCRRNRRSFTYPPIARRRRLLGPGSKALSVRGGRLHWQHLEMRGWAGANPSVRGRQRHADPLQRPAQAEGVGVRNREAIKHAQGAHRFGASSRNHHARDAPGRNRVRRSVGPGITETETASSSRKERRPREGADDGVDFVASG